MRGWGRGLNQRHEFRICKPPEGAGAGVVVINITTNLLPCISVNLKYSSYKKQEWGKQNKNNIPTATIPNFNCRYPRFWFVFCFLFVYHDFISRIKTYVRDLCALFTVLLLLLKQDCLSTARFMQCFPIEINSPIVNSKAPSVISHTKLMNYL